MAPSVECSSPANVVEPFLSVTSPIARLIKGARQCPAVLWVPVAETRRFNAYALEMTAARPRVAVKVAFTTFEQLQRDVRMSRADRGC